MANAKSRSSQLLELVDSDSDDGLSGGLTRISAAKPTKAIGANVAHNKNINDRVNKVNKTKTAKMPPAKKAARGRQAAAANKVTKPGQKNTTASTRAAANERIAAAVEDQLEEDSRTALIEKSTNVQPKTTATGRGRKRAAAPATAPEEVEAIDEDVEMEDAPAPAPKASRGRPKRAAVEEVPDSQPPPPARGRKKGAAKKQPEPVVEEDEEEEMNETTEIPETQQVLNMTVIEEEEDEAEQLEELLRAQKASSSEHLRGRNHPGAEAPPSPSKSRPVYGSASPSKTSSNPALRRRLGEMTQKYENLEQKYQNLREIAVKEAESNFEKLRKQTDEKSRVADELIASLKAELAAQKEATKELPRLQKQLEASEAKVQALETKNAQLATCLAESKTEIKALSMKLTAARTAEAAAAAKAVPGSAVKGASSRMNSHHMMTTSNSEAVRQATLKGQKREDLYADLTGLIIRTIPGTTTTSTTGNKDDGVAAGDVIYDCIQTGKNGTLHFKLLEVVDDLEGAGGVGEEPQLRYMPQLDPDRDRAMMEILPNFLVDEIEFPRSHVDKFYARVVKALTGA
ncbi:hypothetical protein V8F33_002496 [Rhypophila sp. PSN 637]